MAGYSQEELDHLRSATGLQSDQAIADQLMTPADGAGAMSPAGGMSLGAPPAGTPLIQPGDMQPGGQQASPPPGFNRPLIPPSWTQPTNPNAPSIDYTNPEIGAGGAPATNAAPPPAPAGAPPAEPPPPAPPGPDMSNVVSRTAANGGATIGAEGQGGASAQAPKIAPAGWTNVMAPGARGPLAAGQANELAGIQGQAEAKSGELANQADIRKGGGEQIEAQRLQEQSDYEKQVTAAHNTLGAITARRRELEAAKIDPTHFYKTKSAVQVIGLAIAQGLGAFGAAMTHTTNTAAEIIQQAIDHDVAAQRDALERRGKSLQDETSLYAEHLRELGDAHRAAAATRQEMWQGVENQVKTAALQSQGAEVKAAAQQMIGTAQQKQALELAQWNKYHPAALVGGTAQGTSDVKPDEVIRLADGRYVTVPDTAQRAKVSGKIHMSQDIDSALTRIKALAATPLLQRGPTWKKEIQEAGKVFTAPEIMEGAGKGGLGIFKAFTDPVSPTFGVFTPGVAKNAQDIADRVRAEAHHALGTSAGHVVTPTTIANTKTGERERRYIIQGEYKQDEHPEGSASHFASRLGATP